MAETLYDLVNATPYPRGWVLTYTNKYNPELSDAVVSLGHNKFVRQIGQSGQLEFFNSYDEWIATLPLDAQSDVGLKEYDINGAIKNVNNYINAVVAAGGGSH